MWWNTEGLCTKLSDCSRVHNCIPKPCTWLLSRMLDLQAFLPSMLMRGKHKRQVDVSQCGHVAACWVTTKPELWTGPCTGLLPHASISKHGTVASSSSGGLLLQSCKATPNVRRVLLHETTYGFVFVTKNVMAGISVWSSISSLRFSSVYLNPQSLL